MMGHDNVLAINADIGRQAAEAVVGLEAKVRASMLAVLEQNWMTADDTELMRAGIGGALIDMDGTEDGNSLQRTVDFLRALTAYLTAINNGLKVELPEKPADFLPLLQWWSETKKLAKERD